jgi:hypothetical protein
LIEKAKTADRVLRSVFGEKNEKRKYEEIVVGGSRYLLANIIKMR